MGLPAAKPLPRDPKITLDVWHEKVLAQGLKQPGPVWQQLAAELMLANMDQPVWAWADTSAMALLDFWAQFDPGIRFLLLAETPAHALLRSTPKADETTTDADAALQQWQNTHQHLLHFALRQPQRCTLVWSHHAQSDPQQLAALLAAKWQLPWQAQPAKQASTPVPCPLAEHLANHLTQTSPLAQQLMQELHACVTPLQSQLSAPPAPLQLLMQYQALQSQAVRAQQIGPLQKQLTHSQTEHQAKQKQLQEQIEQALKAQEKTQAQLQELRAQHEKCQQQLDRSTAELHKTQQNLEQSQKSLRTAQDTAARLPELQKQLDSTRQQLQDKAQQAEQQQQQIKTLTEQTAQLQKAVQDKTQSLAQQEQTAAQLKSVTDTLQKTEHERAELQQESDQLLAQLHETQEELESYCIQNEELQQQISVLGGLQQRWHRLFETHRDLYAVESVRFELHHSQPLKYGVTLTGLHMAGRHFEQLQLGLTVDDSGCAVVSIDRPSEGAQPLLRWPAGVHAGGTLQLHPGTAADTPPERIAHFMQLSTSDWQVSQDLPRLLQAAIEQRPDSIEPGDLYLLTSALQRYQRESQPLRQIVRFDSAYLLELATPERICLQLERLSHENAHADQLTLTLERGVAQQADKPIVMTLTPTPVLGNNDTLQMTLGPQGWQDSTGQTLEAALQTKVMALLGALPLALVDAVHNGADKDQIKPWLQTVRQLRQPFAAETHVAPLDSVASVATDKQKPPKTQKAKPTNKPAVKTRAAKPEKTAPSKPAQVQDTSKAPSPPPQKHAANTRHKARA